MKLIPSRTQFRKWSLPSKATYISFVIACVSVLKWFFNGSGAAQTTNSISTTSGTVAQGETVQVNNYFAEVGGPKKPPSQANLPDASIAIETDSESVDADRIYIPSDLTPEELHRRYMADSPAADLHKGHFVPQPGWKAVVSRRPQQERGKRPYLELRRLGQLTPVLHVWVSQLTTAYEKGNEVYVYGRIKDVRTNIVILESATVKSIED